MKFRFVLKNGTVVEGDQHVEQAEITHVIKTHIPRFESEPEDCVYDIIVLKDEDILQREFTDVSYDELIEYLELVKKSKEEENCNCSSCVDKDCEDCDESVYSSTKLDDVRSYV